MRAEVSRFRTLQPLAFRRLTGVVADVWHVAGEQGGGGFYVSPDPRLVVFLDAEPPQLQVKTDQARLERPRALFIPAGVPLWSRLDRPATLSHIDFHLERGALGQRLSQLSTASHDTHLIAERSQLLTLARMAAAEVEAPSRTDLMLDGLLTALLGDVLGPKADAQGGDLPKGGLTASHRAALIEFLHLHLGQPITVAQMAQAVGLSESWFARAFKTSFDETPLRYVAQMRLQAARDLMTDPSMHLADIAYATGFADQAHLSRMFRARFGQPPSQWRRRMR
ncbi:hypothetical protein BFP70_04730 [Thioclava sp. SK-1]|nr:hypothetical protein BFP70_04730 [Thioclava sp. SK-1]